MSSRDFTWSVEHEVSIERFTCAPEEITRRLGLRPTKAFRVGEPLAPNSVRRALIPVWIKKVPEWKGTTEEVNSGKHRRALIRLIDSLYARRRVLSALVRPGSICFKTVVYTTSANTTMRLPLATNRKVVALNAEWVLSVWNPEVLARVLS